MSYPEIPPRRLSTDPKHADFHPCFQRVGIVFEGQERNDVMNYDVTRGLIQIRGKELLFGSVAPFWRWAESRQERRARERYDVEHGAPE